MHHQSVVMTHLFKEVRECNCGYMTQNRGNWSKHRKICKHVAEERRDSEMVELLKQQLATKDEQLAAKDRQIEELLQANKVKKRAPPTRKTLSEPKRRRIAAAQNWKCANPDGMCLLKGDLEEYDVDHRISLARDGKDIPENMQALCPACHRRKTERDNRILVEEGRATEEDP
jgi:5-methylcytosine-specific restriction endonuclease McrA